MFRYKYNNFNRIIIMTILKTILVILGLVYYPILTLIVIGLYYLLKNVFKVIKF